LEPLSELRPSTAQRLEQTLRSWLLHQGRRDDVAADLTVHPQTVRYRMTQLRELYGDRLRDPAVVFDLVIALGA
jgi:DNA-binding PucR family transcriptional regulator